MSRFSLSMLNHSVIFGVIPDLEDQIRGAAAAGFRYVGLDRLSLTAWASKGKSIGQLCEQMTALEISCHELSSLEISSDERMTLAAAESLLDLATTLRPRAILAIVISPPDVMVTRLLARVSQQFAEIGSTLAVEFTPFTPIDSLVSACSLIREAGGGALVLLDSWHFFRGPNTWRDLEEFPVDLISFVQFNDGLPPISRDLLMETSHRRTLPGDGEFDLTKFTEILHKKGFLGVVSIEILSKEMRRRLAHEDFARLALERTRMFWPD